MNAKSNIIKCVVLSAFVVIACAVLVFDGNASAHSGFYGAHLALAVGLDQMRTQHRDLVRRAATKIGEVRDGMSASALAAIEHEHRQLLRDAEAVGDAIAREERSDASSGKPWASKFYAMMAGQPITREELDRMVSTSHTYDQAADKAIDWMASAHNGNKPKPGPNPAIHYGGSESFDNPEFFMQTHAQAVASLISGRAPDHAAAKEIASSHSIRPILCGVLQRNGERFNPHMSLGQLFQKITMSSGAHTQSDFQGILAVAFNLRLKPAYDAAPCPVVDVLSLPRDVDNLRAVNVAALGEQPLLSEVIEGAEITYGSTVDNRETYAMATYAKLFAVTRQVLINDQLAAFNRVINDMGRAAKATVAKAAVSVLLANSGDGATLSDGSPMYSTGRGNKAVSGADLDVDTLSAGRTAMRTMLGLNGVEPIAATPKYILVGAAKETKAEQILHTLNATTVADVNPFSGTLQSLVEPRLAGNSWRLFADTATLPVLEVSYLNGQRAPFVETREGWNMLGTEWRVVMDVGVGATDWRGTYLNPGA